MAKIEVRKRLYDVLPDMT